MSRSGRYAIGALLLLVLLGAGSGYAVARWGQKQSSATDWRPDWGAVQRGWACVTGELEDVADLLTPDRDRTDRDDAPDPAADPIGSPGDTGAAAETGESAESGSPIQSFLERSGDFFASLRDEVPRLDESASNPGDGC